VDGAGSGLDADTLRGLTPEALTERVPGANAPVLVDANGTVVGTFLGGNAGESDVPLYDVLRRVNGKLFRLVVAHTGFVGEIPEATAFTGALCTGTALHLAAPADTVYPPPLIVTPAGNGYHVEASGTQLIASELGGVIPEHICLGKGGTVLGSGRCCLPVNEQFAAAAALTPVDVASLGLVPPFRLDLR
jgi:hypothetical protein